MGHTRKKRGRTDFIREMAWQLVKLDEFLKCRIWRCDSFRRTGYIFFFITVSGTFRTQVGLGGGTEMGGDWRLLLPDCARRPRFGQAWQAEGREGRSRNAAGMPCGRPSRQPRDVCLSCPRCGPRRCSGWSSRWLAACWRAVVRSQTCKMPAGGLLVCLQHARRSWLWWWWWWCLSAARCPVSAASRPSASCLFSRTVTVSNPTIISATAAKKHFCCCVSLLPLLAMRAHCPSRSLARCSLYCLRTHTHTHSLSPQLSLSLRPAPTPAHRLRAGFFLLTRLSLPAQLTND